VRREVVRPRRAFPQSAKPAGTARAPVPDCISKTR
jgi:hypothetical protein